MITCAEGTTAPVHAEFLDEDDSVLIPKAGYPKVRLVDEQGDALYNTGAIPDPLRPGTWTANVSVPVLGLKQKQQLRVRWVMRTQSGDKYTYSENIIVAPTVEKRESDIVLLPTDGEFSFVIPHSFSTQSSSGAITIYKDNDVLSQFSVSDPLVSIDSGVDRTAVYIDTSTLTDLNPSLAAYTMNVRLRLMGGRPIAYPFKLWCITPSIMKAMTAMQDFLNKARVENVIPQLEYTAGDILGYLERGLYFFNRLVTTTAFNGTNMQGMLYDAWIVCSSYHALSAQLLAEGSLAFDFSGQGLSLNVDRTPQLEAALGRIESDIDNRIVPFKKEIVKQGNTTGDGSNGDTNMRNVNSFAKLALSNSPTTRLNGLGISVYGRRVRGR